MSNRIRMIVVLCIVLCTWTTHASNSQRIRVEDYLPEGYRTDGSISYQTAIQAALDRTKELGGVVIFPPGTFLINDPRGLRVFANTTLILDGASFLAADEMNADGQVFLIENNSNVAFSGGLVVGKRDSWEPGTNIGGIRVLGSCRDIRVDNMQFVDLSSNAIGMFGNSPGAISDVRITRVTSRNCCNVYRDYLEVRSGPVSGSNRKDQGAVAFYHVDEWSVTECTFDGSTSDGTHFYRCSNGRFVNNVVAGSRMGGYFLEGCENVLANGNIISGNGSRGVTIERDSRFCTLINNIIEFSGREGLWAPDVEGLVIANNVFRENGRKNDAAKDSEIRIDETSKWGTRTADIQIVNNIFYTTAHQEFVVRVGIGTSRVTLQNNLFRGPARETFREGSDTRY